MRVYFHSMNNLSVRCQRAIAELISQRVPLGHIEIDALIGRYVRIVTGTASRSQHSVATL